MKRKDVTHRMNEASHQERTPSHITAQLFSTPSLAASCLSHLHIPVAIRSISSSSRLALMQTCTDRCTSCSFSLCVRLLVEEMDLNRNGMVDLKEFLYSMIRWAGLETEDDGSNEASP